MICAADYICIREYKNNRPTLKSVLRPVAQFSGRVGGFLAKHTRCWCHKRVWYYSWQDIWEFHGRSVWHRSWVMPHLLVDIFQYSCINNTHFFSQHHNDLVRHLYSLDFVNDYIFMMSSCNRWLIKVWKCRLVARWTHMAIGGLWVAGEFEVLLLVMVKHLRLWFVSRRSLK